MIDAVAKLGRLNRQAGRWHLGLGLALLALAPAHLQAQPAGQLAEQGRAKPESYHDLGNDFYYKGDYDNAISNLTKAVHYDPGDAWAYDCRALARAEKGDSDGAIADFRTALRINPDYAGVYNDCGWFFQYKKHDLRIAIIDYTEAIRRDPTNADTFVSRAKAYLEQTNDDKAFADFARAIQLQSTNNTDIFIRRGQAHLDRKNYGQALKDFNIAVKLDPAKAADVCYKEYGGYLTQATNYEDISKAYDEAVQANPTDDIYCFFRGCFQENQTNYEGAIADFTHCIQLQPTNASYYISRGRLEIACAKTFTRLGDHHKENEYIDRGLDDHRQAAALDPIYLSGLGRLECHRGQYEQGIADFTKYIQGYPTNLNGWDLRAFAYERAAMDYAKHGKLVEKDAALDRALADWNHLVAVSTEEKTTFTCYRGDFYARNNQYAKALSEYHQAIELQPTNNVIGWASLGLLLATCPDPTFRNGTNAMAYAQKAFEMQPHWIGDGSFISMAAACAETGDFEQAVKFQESQLNMMEAQEFGTDSFRTELKERLALYEQGKPCHRILGIYLFD